MNAFESVVSSLLVRQGYWTRIGFKVGLTRDDKFRIGRPSSPRWEVDIIAYKPAINELLVVECKSYLDSTGVQIKAFTHPESAHGKRFKLFNEAVTRDVVLGRLRVQLLDLGLVAPNPDILLCLAAAKIRGAEDETRIRQHFDSNAWRLIGPQDIKEMLTSIADESYEDSVAAITTKILLR